MNFNPFSGKKIFFIFSLLGLFLFSFTNLSWSDQKYEPPKVKYEKAKVVEAENIYLDDQPESQLAEKRQQVTIKILSGKFKGKVLSLDHIASGGMAGTKLNLTAGDKILLYVEENPGKAESPDGSPLINVDGYLRSQVLFWLAILYALVLVVIGGKKGAKALLSLVLTMATVFFILFPLILLGFNPLLVTVVICGFISLLVFRIIAGKTAKAFSAATGTLIGVAIAGILATLAGNIIHLSGLSSEEAKILFYSLNLKANFQGLLFSGILIGALGAVMDVGISIASAIDEVRKVHPEANFSNLFKAGMNVGHDIMGTMSNTLILAYTGSALPLLLLFNAGNMPFAKIINMELVAEEIVRALAGSIGLVLCIPATALVAAAMYTRKKSSNLPKGWIRNKL
ncbi:hypothetical protein A2291_08630 [candidate division WOR-1 bacterium RIFOXYB2_FULL_42_35]|uniref:YibE/F family protein n=1 Tax=candidate division WOR-1 bacterium RIFOXYC2_FULL_41_25 TaxID=1802586 RepID=A0A1F4TLP3_UNCSA|nr:MAG: hypothetical protein A2291_08630 [candidate division WOR-1 bacterium RIFOXYB2_FULL_42_35]OGC23070.1 MAG: hypothetical protein A2247_08530 [candidate division WOR-1 bacterium RIFOXYA2_FULL_41_14]OGC33642.1 MAG: hypothetical protein A2462_02220 [candidate division WOR-1 bacterium RIFOXYC2_FULL_41_25]OGC43605.1 MAG: hypothetical protein A2548_02310 [candidate division WOR-1 bacterium RIFOXYD2_FULL_41_8]